MGRHDSASLARRHMTRIIKIGTWECERQESQTCLMSIAVIPKFLEDGPLFYAATLPLLL